MNALRTEMYKGYTITLEHDMDLQDPIHEYQDDYVLVSLHRRYGKTRGFRMTEEFEDALRENIRAVDGGALENYGFEWEGDYIIPVWLFDHSGLIYSTSPFGCRFDSGLYGFMLYRPSFLKNQGWDKWEPSVLSEDAVAVLKEYQIYANGEGCGYIVTLGGEEIDACWGFYDEKYALERAKESIDYIAENQGDKDKAILEGAGFNYCEGTWTPPLGLLPYVSKDGYTLLEALKVAQTIEKLKEI